MYFIYHLSTIVFGVFLIFFYLQKLLSRNSRSSAIVWVAYIIFGIGLMALNVVPVMPIVRTIYTWLGILVLCKVCYRSAPLNAVYVATVFCALAFDYGAPLLKAACNYGVGVSGRYVPGV